MIDGRNDNRGVNADGPYGAMRWLWRDQPVSVGPYDTVEGSSAPEIEWARKIGAPPDRFKRETPAHTVAIKPFAMSTTEMTRDVTHQTLAMSPDRPVTQFALSRA